MPSDTPTMEDTMPAARMTRSRDGMIAGVMQGMADYFGWSPKRLRIAFVILSVGTAAFPGMLLYLCLWFVMPPDGS